MLAAIAVATDCTAATRAHGQVARDALPARRLTAESADDLVEEIWMMYHRRKHPLQPVTPVFHGPPRRTCRQRPIRRGCAHLPAQRQISDSRCWHALAGPFCPTVFRPFAMPL